jgi:Ala-tRNA(Pro) deacylase
MSVFDRLTELLDRHHVPYDVLRHDPVFTSEEAARIRGTPLASGAKALICKTNGRFVLFVMPADRRLDSKQVRKAFGLKGVRFATREEVYNLTTLTPGAIPPMGQLFGLVTYCDNYLSAQPRINFNAGDHAVSVNMASADYLTVEKPIMGRFAEIA